MKKILLFAVALAAMGAVQTVARAETGSVTGGIKGQVKDQASGDGLEGVTVVATSPALQGTQSEITDDTGSYEISNLPPGVYLVTFYYADVTVKHNNVIVELGKVTPVYIKLDTNQAGGEVHVITRSAPAIDTSSTKQVTTINQDYTRNIPVPGRTFAAVLGAAPGSQGDLYGVSFSGSSSLENQYIVDGVNTTGLTYGTIGTALVNDFIQETEIITGGYNAEYGRATGGVVNVVTKSGSNEFHGSVFSTVSPGFAIASAQRTPTEGTPLDATANRDYDWDFGFDLGGPIVKDKVWFYVGFAPRVISDTITKITQRRTDCRRLNPDNTLTECDPEMYADGEADFNPDTGFIIYEELDRDDRQAQTTSYQFVSKVNFAVSPEHQGQVSLTGTPLSGETAGVRGDPAATTRDYTALTTDVSAKWTSKFNNNDLQLDAVLGWHRDAFRSDSIDDAANGIPHQDLFYGQLGDWAKFGFESQATLDGCTDSNDPRVDRYPGIENCPDVGVGYAIGGIGGIGDEKEERFTGKLSLTQRLKAAGHHVIMGGLDTEDNLLDKSRTLSGDVYYEVLLGNRAIGGSYDYTIADRYVRLAPPGGSPGFEDNCGYRRDENGDPDMTQPIPCDFLGPTQVKGNTINWAGYLRDSWSILPNLTLNYGVRYEEQRLRYSKDLQNTVDPLTNHELGTNAMLLRNMWAPRLGATYDWTKEGRGKVYGSWGRFYESIPMDINDREFGGETYYQAYYDNSQCGPVDPRIGGPSGPGCTSSGADPFDSTLYGSGVLVAPGVKPQYLDEVLLGAEYELLEDLRVGLSFQNRRLGRVIEDVSVDNADTYIIANPGEFSDSEENSIRDQIAGLPMDSPERSQLQGELDQYVKIRNFDKPTRNYNAIQLVATKRFSRNFFVQSSYTYSRIRGNYPGLFSAETGQLDPNITSQYDLIELLSNRYGPLPQDRPHYLKFDGFYQWDFKKLGQLVTGVRLRALSGIPINALARSWYGPGESYLLPRGSLGRTSWERGVDLHVAYARDLRKGMRLEVFSDLFNVFNDQGEAGVDEEYTLSFANPVVGGTVEDLVYLKGLTSTGAEIGTNLTADPATRRQNFMNTAVRHGPFAARFGLRLTF